MSLLIIGKINYTLNIIQSSMQKSLGCNSLWNLMLYKFYYLKNKWLMLYKKVWL